MTHLVKKHDTGEYCLSEGDPSTLTRKCEECGDRDKILLSFENDRKVEAFESYFSQIKKDDKQIINGCREYENTREEMVNMVHLSYGEDRTMIGELFEQDIISEGEFRRLNKLNRQAELKQLKIVRDCFRFHVIVKNVNYKNKLLLKMARK